jgi:hypothetical protein
MRVATELAENETHGSDEPCETICWTARALLWGCLSAGWRALRGGVGRPPLSASL